MTDQLTLLFLIEFALIYDTSFSPLHLLRLASDS